MAALAIAVFAASGVALYQDIPLLEIVRSAVAQAEPWRVVPVAAAMLLFALAALTWFAGRLVAGRTDPGRPGDAVSGPPDTPGAGAVQAGPPLDARESGLSARIQGALSAQRAFVADAAHELRSPLTALKLQIQIAERADSPEARLAAFAKVHQRLDRSVHLVQQLLTLARHERPVAPPELKDLDLVPLAQAVVADRSIDAAQRRIDLGVVYAVRDPVTVRANAEGLSVLLGNLVDNALGHTPEGGKVDVAVLARPGEICLEVSDNGPGVPDSARPRLFDRFYRGEEPSGRGAGLGLAIVKSIADYHGAQVELGDNAAAGHGLVVTVRFAREAARAPDLPFHQTL